MRLSVSRIYNCFKIKREFPLGINYIFGAWSHVRTEVGVSRTHVNFVEFVLFLYLAQMYLRADCFVN
jgi:hypothetical protein